MLTTALCEDLCLDRAKGLTVKQLAEDYEVCPGRVYAILKGWRPTGRYGASRVRVKSSPQQREARLRESLSRVRGILDRIRPGSGTA